MRSSVSLDDKYLLDETQVLLNGYQSLVRLCIMQKECDRRAGLNTAGYVTGYRGSPLGGVDLQFMRAKRHLDQADVRFQPGLNEDLAATAIWGSQQAELRREGLFDGVFSIWYGKGPGVDRSGDVFRHANLAGTAKNGGVLALMGDDHTAESSTAAHQSEFRFVDVMMPILHPAGIQEILDYGRYGWAMSRFSGTWTGLKCMKDTIESTAIVDGSLDRMKITIPTDFVMPEGGLNIRHFDTIPGQEARLHDFKRDAMSAFIRANALNRIVASGGRTPKIGIVTTGKSYLDTRHALDRLGLDLAGCNDFGIRLLKVGCPWPLNRQDLREFAEGLALIIVVEEKRSLMEAQVREELYGTASQPVVIGKKDEWDNWLFPVKGALDPNSIAIAIGSRMLRYGHSDRVAARVRDLEQSQRALEQMQDVAGRTPYFCSGCPHNSSTVVPSGMRAYAGIGCHYMAQWMGRSTLGFTQMGGEGANWIGEAPFSKRPHMFQNLGDGTYNHSGYLAIRAAAASGVNITYKILFNDAVAMTGGQSNEGGLNVPQIARQVAAEGARRVVVVTDEPGKYPSDTAWPPGLAVHHRDELMRVQTELAKISGLTVLIYDQTCAAEKRRRRKRGLYPDPNKRVIINERICEGCGDCSVQSNCVSVQPLETSLGRKGTIDQSSCNKDFSCVKGHCPAIVTVHGAELKKAAGGAEELRLPAIPAPRLPDISRTYNIIVAGIGGSGVVTVAGVLGMAAHLEAKGFGAIDMAGLAQKGGAVYSHIRIANTPADISAIRVGVAEADLVLGSDMAVTATKKVLAAVNSGSIRLIVNLAESLPGDFVADPDFSLPTERIRKSIISAGGTGMSRFVDATRVVTTLIGNSIAANFFLVGYAYQLGALPLSGEAIEKAIELNGEAVAMNQMAFRLGRIAAADPAAIAALEKPASGRVSSPSRARSSLSETIASRAAFLVAYENENYAARYQRLVEHARRVETAKAPGKTGLADAVARGLFKLMAYKDEYEVARLYTDGEFAKQVAAQFDGADLRVEFHLAPPFLAPKDTETGHPKKVSFGPWLMIALRVIAKFKFLRGTRFDPFGRTAERRAERKLISDYESLLDEIFTRLNVDNHNVAVELASIPEKIRGFGHVKLRHLAVAKVEEGKLLDLFRNCRVPVKTAERGRHERELIS